MDGNTIADSFEASSTIGREIGSTDLLSSDVVFGNSSSFKNAAFDESQISNAWSYVAPTVDQFSLDAGTVTTDADGKIVPMGTDSEVETPEEPEVQDEEE